MPRFGWKFGPRWNAYYSEKEVSRDKVQKDAASILAKASKGDAWRSGLGVTHYPILLGGEIVGNLWENVDLDKLEVGAYWSGPFGIKAELVYDKKVVGVLWLEA